MRPLIGLRGPLRFRVGVTLGAEFLERVAEVRLIAFDVEDGVSPGLNDGFRQRFVRKECIQRNDSVR